MVKRKLHNGRDDGLTPLESLNLSEISSFSDLLEAMGKTAFSGRQIGNAFQVLLEMWRAGDCTVVLTVSGAMTVAKQGRIICDMIDRGMVQALVATGALIAHGLTEAIGLTHYYAPDDCDDRDLFLKGYNRIYDTLEMEANLDDVEALIADVLESSEPEDGIWSSSKLCRAIGKRLEVLNHGPGILRSALRKNIPVFIPAFTDSEVGLDCSIWAMRKALARSEFAHNGKGANPEHIFKAVPAFNPFFDLQEYARIIAKSDSLGIFTIGGGVPRNWAQQVAPYFDIASERLDIPLKTPRFQYGIRICPEPVHWGGLSGCTYSEGVSWGKFMSPEEDGRFAEVFADATLVLPLLMKAVFEKLDSAD